MAIQAYHSHLTSTFLLLNNICPLSTTSDAWHLHLSKNLYKTLKSFLSHLHLLFFSQLSNMVRIKVVARKNLHPRTPAPSPSPSPTRSPSKHIRKSLKYVRKSQKYIRKSPKYLMTFKQPLLVKLIKIKSMQF